MLTKIIKVLNDMTKSIDESGMKYGIHPDSIDEELLKEEKEIIKLHYDKSSKMMTVGSATFLGSAALSISLYGRISFLFWFFLLTSIISIFRTWYWNVRMLKCFNTAINKIRKESKKIVL